MKNTFSLSISISFPTLSRIDDYILPKDEFYKAPNGLKGKRRFFSFLVRRSQWMGKQTFQTDDDGPQKKE